MQGNRTPIFCLEGRHFTIKLPLLVGGTITTRLAFHTITLNRKKSTLLVATLVSHGNSAVCTFKEVHISHRNMCSAHMFYPIAE